jgi:hypothetical protein
MGKLVKLTLAVAVVAVTMQVQLHMVEPVVLA